MKGEQGIKLLRAAHVSGRSLQHDLFCLLLLSTRLSLTEHFSGICMSPRQFIGPSVGACVAGVSFHGVLQSVSSLSVFNSVQEMSLAEIDALDRRDGCGYGHSRRVSILAGHLAAALGMSAHHVARISLAGLLHDLGKGVVPEWILTKPGRLTDDEYKIIQRHPAEGYEMLRGIAGLEDVLPGVLHHHERYDGAGYPFGLIGKAIPDSARILAIADTYDAMRSSRAYRGSRSHAETLAEIHACAGRQLDPFYVAEFVRLDSSNLPIQLSDERIARVAA